MQRFTEGDQVRIDIPDQNDPGYETFHGKHGVVTGVLEVDTGDSRDIVLYRVEFDDGTELLENIV